MRAALFLWITFFLAALSAREIALRISLEALVFLARRTAKSKLERVLEFILAFLRELFKALLAVLVTGTIVSIYSWL